MNFGITMQRHSQTGQVQSVQMHASAQMVNEEDTPAKTLSAKYWKDRLQYDLYMKMQEQLQQQQQQQQLQAAMRHMSCLSQDGLRPITTVRPAHVLGWPHDVGYQRLTPWATEIGTCIGHDAANFTKTATIPKHVVQARGTIETKEAGVDNDNDEVSSTSSDGEIMNVVYAAMRPEDLVRHTVGKSQDLARAPRPQREAPKSVATPTAPLLRSQALLPATPAQPGEAPPGSSLDAMARRVLATEEAGVEADNDEVSSTDSDEEVMKVVCAAMRPEDLERQMAARSQDMARTRRPQQKAPQVAKRAAPLLLSQALLRSPAVPPATPVQSCQAPPGNFNRAGIYSNVAAVCTADPAGPGLGPTTVPKKVFPTAPPGIFAPPRTQPTVPPSSAGQEHVLVHFDEPETTAEPMYVDCSPSSVVQVSANAGADPDDAAAEADDVSGSEAEGTSSDEAHLARMIADVRRFLDSCRDEACESGAAVGP